MDKSDSGIPRRDFIILLGAMARPGLLLNGQPPDSLLNGPLPDPAPQFENQLLQVSIIGSKDCLWSYRTKGSGRREHRLSPPVFNIDGHRSTAELTGFEASRQPERLGNGTIEYRYEGTFAESPELSLEMWLRVADDSPIIRFCYTLKSTASHTLTKSSGRDDLAYLGMTFVGLSEAKEVRLSDFLELAHSYWLEEAPLEPRAFEDEFAVMGPMLVASDGRHTILVAYEHGSQVPDAFLEFRLRPDRSFTLEAVKANYLAEQIIDQTHPYQTVWLQTGSVDGTEGQLASAYRTFVLKYMAENTSTRQPYIYYDTWNFQERNKWWYGKTYLDSMNEGRILEEVDAAQRMGIDVFLLDSGWYERTGDWPVSLKRFPGGLRSVKARLESYGMKLGVWMGPTSAAVLSQALRDHRDCVMSWRGAEAKPQLIWETEASYPMCLVSRYSDAVAAQMIRLVHEVGIAYFTWDGVDQYACDSPNHWHGTERHSAEERADSYAFQLIQQLVRIANKVSAACPGVMVDYDITEPRRAMGLAFLSAGKHLLINNGPYYSNYDIPFDPERQNANIFFYKGAARAWICRTPLTYDKWIPSVLFLTYYFPDDPREAQLISLASLILGQNGIWGDLPRVSAAGADFIGQTLARYKQIGNDITASDPIVTGHPSGSPEIHEKIHAGSGRGAVSVFAAAKGHYSYVTAHKVAARHWATEGVSLTLDDDGRALLDLNFEQPGAKIVLFGVE